MRLIPLAASFVILALCACTAAQSRPFEGEPIVLSNDGGWCWFEEPRVVIADGWLVVGSVASGWQDSERRGDVEAIVHRLATGETQIVELADRFELDDHDAPAFLHRPDGRWLTMFARHGSENRAFYRISEPGDPAAWGPTRTFIPTERTRLTYSNLFLLPDENNRIYDFYRGLDNSYKPSYAWSDDFGNTWQSGNIVINVPTTERHRPYVRYASNGRDAVHMLYTEAHPRDYDNSVYHIFYRDGTLHRSDGTPIAPLTEGLASPSQGTLIFRGDADHVAWTVDIVLDTNERPVVVYSVQVGSAGLPPGQGGDDIRYRYARWDGEAWQDHALAYAGSRLYAGEDDYTGLAAIDPDDPSTVYISTNAHPETGRPLISATDGRRHYEIWRGTTADGGTSWQWTPLTSDSTADNLRPIIASADGWRVLVWLRGSYRSYTDYQQEVLGIIQQGRTGITRQSRR